MKLPTALVAWADDVLSPITVRELRQAVRGRALASLLLLFLLADLVVVGLATFGPSAASGDWAYQGIGRTVFMGLLGVFLVMAMLFVPLYTGVRMTQERFEGNLDLLFVTSLRPASIIFGKLCTGWILILFFLCAGLPFMTLTFFFRGVDLPTASVTLALALVLASASVQLAILIASIPSSRPFRALLGLGGLVIMVALLGAVITWFNLMLQFGAGSLAGPDRFWKPALGVLTVSLVGTGLLFTLATAAVMPSSANRARPVRLIVLLNWMAFGIGAVLWARAAHNLFPVRVWVGLFIALSCILLLSGVSERESLGLRLRRAIPRSLARRAIAWLFHSGRTGGLAFAVLLFALTVLAGLGVESLMPELSGDSLEELLLQMGGVFVFTFFYALAALFLRTRFLKRKVSAGYTWVVALLLIGLGSWIPLMVGFLAAGGMSRDTLYPWTLLNPFSVLDPAHQLECLTFGCAAALLAGALSVPWYVREVSTFRPLPTGAEAA